MADLTITPASVKPVWPSTGSAGTSPQQGRAGAALGQGVVVYLATTGKWLAADAGMDLLTDVGGDAQVGITVNRTDAADQPVSVMQGGEVLFGTILTVGVEYVISANSGKICPKGDLTTGKFYHRLGYASTTSNLVMDVGVTGVQIP